LFLDFKLVVVNHSYHDYGKAFKSSIIKFLMKKKVDKVVAVSQGVNNATKRMFSLEDSEVVTIYNGCDLDNIRKLSNEKIDFLWWDHRDVKIISIGRLSNIKGQSHLVKLVKEMKDRGINKIKLLIIGGYGPHKDELMKFIESLGLENNVKVLDFIENPFPYLKQADIFYLSSDSEGLSIVLLEALALKKPVISTDSLVGPREIILGESNYDEIVKDNYVIGKYGILTPVMGRSCWDNPNAPISKSQKINADALYMLINNKSLMIKYRETKFPEQFLIASMHKKYRELYLDLLC
jgi:glycosyltransferase involved in cell wall biosynthesis